MIEVAKCLGMSGRALDGVRKNSLFERIVPE